MAKLVIGTNKQTVVPAVVRDMSPELYRVFRNNNGKLENSRNTPFIPLPNTITDVSAYCLYMAYYGTSSSVLSGTVDLSNLTQLSGERACYNMFAYCYGITGIDLSNLTTVSGTWALDEFCNACTSLTSVDLSSLTTVSGMGALTIAFQGTTALTNISFPSLTTLSGMNAMQSAFSNSGITSATFPVLNNISGSNAFQYVFQGCQNLESVSFGGLKASTFSSAVNQLQYLFSSYTGRNAPNGCTVHFPSNFDPSDPSHTFDASTLTGYPTFGGSSSYIHVAFDLPATE